MLKPFQQYSSVIRFSIQNTVVYRINFLVQAVFNLIPLFTGIAVWRTIYAGGKTSIAGYTALQMLSYYLVAAIVDALTSTTEDDWQIASEIKDGRISQFLVKPFDYRLYRLCMFASGRLVFSLAALIPVGAFVAFNSDALVGWPDGLSLGLFGLSILCSALNQFLLTFLTATLAFWVLEISSFSFILLAFQRLAGGLMFPLDILPVGLHKALILTPFACQVYVPIEIFLGRTTPSGLLGYCALELFWVLALWILVRLVWKRGMRAYGAFGG